ncbi:hypothetical protein ACHAL6_00105 [Proteiniclasticum sp. C24MP]|uniref:hypothetical protein n=1 Tax=Proteiniclasticum sp. C24MP TaxID=3374101 RepID=UPI003754FD34
MSKYRKPYHKGTIEEIEDRREKLKRIIREVSIDSQSVAKTTLFLEHLIDVSIATINRDFNELGIELITLENGNKRYVLSQEDTRKYNLSQLNSILNTYTTGGFKRDLSFLAISVNGGYADFLGTKFVELYPSSFMGYMTSNNLLLLITDNKNGEIENSFYDDMKIGKFIAKE